MYARQAIARGDDMCYMVVIPSIRLYRFEVGNILGEVQDTINRRYGIYLHHSDLTMEQADGNPVNRGYNFLDVVFSSVSSNWGQNFTPGYKICNLVVNYEQNIEALMLPEEVHLAMWEQWFAELVWSLEKGWKRELHFQPWFNCFSCEKGGMRIHVSVGFAALRIAWWNLHSSLVQICPCFETLCFSRKSWRVWILSLFTWHFPKGKLTAYLEVVWQCHRSHLKGLASELAKKRQYNVVMILLNGNGSMLLVVVRFSLTKILLSAPFECTPLGTSKRALEKCWFGRSRPSTDGEAEFNIERSWVTGAYDMRSSTMKESSRKERWV